MAGLWLAVRLQWNISYLQRVHKWAIQAFTVGIDPVGYLHFTLYMSLAFLPACYALKNQCLLLLDLIINGLWVSKTNLNIHRLMAELQHLLVYIWHLLYLLLRLIYEHMIFYGSMCNGVEL